MKLIQLFLIVLIFQESGIAQFQFYSVNGYVYKDNNCNGVRDGNDEAVIGHNIIIEGTASGTITDVSGRYTMTISTGQNTLVASTLSGYYFNNPGDGKLTIPLPPLTFNENNFGFCMTQNNCDPPESVVPQILLESGDLYIEQSCNGVILRAPNGSCYRVKINNDGSYGTDPVTCP